MACNDCPELNPDPNEGCLTQINSECVTYDGNDVDCADGGTIIFTIRFTDNDDVIHFANVNFDIPDFETSGDNCDNDLTPSSVTFDDI